MSGFHTLIVTDLDDHFVYMLIVNVTEEEDSGDTIYPLSKSPDVQRKSTLYRQFNYIKPFTLPRKRFDLQEFIIRNYLEKLASTLTSYYLCDDSSKSHHHTSSYPFRTEYGEEWNNRVSDSYFPSGHSHELSVPFRTNSNLDERQRKFCSCVLKVKSSLSEDNYPYAVCAKSTGTTRRN